MANLINNLTDIDWKEAENYFQNNPNAVKFDKYNKYQKLIQDKNQRIKEVNCSFIKVNDVIYAIKNGTAIGEGNFGKVKVIQNKEGENFAVKIEGRGKRGHANTELKIMDLLNKFHGEAERKNYNKIFKNNYTSKKLYTVMDLEEGKELFEVLFLGKSRKSIRRITNEEKKIIIAIKSCEAIKYLHDRRIIHRDIKSENFIINRNDNVANIVAVDFGFSTILPINKNTIKDDPMGTPGFCAPEIVQRKGNMLIPQFPALYSFASDIYSLGIMFKYDLKLSMGKSFYKTILNSDPNHRFSMVDLLDKLHEKLEMQPNLSPMSKIMIEDYKEKNINLRIELKDNVSAARTVNKLAEIISSYSGDLLDENGRKLNKKIVADNILSIFNNHKLTKKALKEGGITFNEAKKFGIENHGIYKKLNALIFKDYNEKLLKDKIKKASSIPALIKIIQEYPGDMYANDNDNLINRETLILALEESNQNKNNFQRLSKITRNYGIREKAVKLLGSHIPKNELNLTLKWQKDLPSFASNVNDPELFKQKIQKASSIEELFNEIENCSDTIYSVQEKFIVTEYLRNIIDNPFLRKKIQEGDLDCFENFPEKNFRYGVVDKIQTIIHQSYKPSLNEIQCLNANAFNRFQLSRHNNPYKGINWMLDRHKSIGSLSYTENELSQTKIRELLEVIQNNQSMSEKSAQEIYKKLHDVEISSEYSEVRSFITELKNNIENEFLDIQQCIIKQPGGNNKINPF